MKSMRKINVRLEGTSDIQGICWYGDISANKIEELIKKIFNLPEDKSIFLKDSEGDIIVFTNNIPLFQTYTVSSSLINKIMVMDARPTKVPVQTVVRANPKPLMFRSNVVLSFEYRL